MPFEEIKANDEERTEAIILLTQRLSGFETEEGRLKGLSYMPKISDEVVITTTPKAGTTWVQQVSNPREFVYHCVNPKHYFIVAGSNTGRNGWF